MEDLKGKKIRAHTALLEESMRALGASPITMAAEEMYTAMQQGVIDGMLTTTAYAAPNKLQEVAPHMTKVSISAVVYPIVINKNFWDSLTEQQQQIILEAIRKAVQHNRDNLEAKSNEYESTLQNGGLQIHQLQDSERALWVEKLKPIYDKTAQKLDGDLFNRVMKFVEGQ
jgi:C4-dicarboxylate-binding protein DctP